MIDFIRYRKFFYFLSLALILASVFGLLSWGLRWGIDFRGGSSLYFEYQEMPPPVEAVRSDLEELGLSVPEVRLAGEKGLMIQTTSYVDEPMQAEIRSALEAYGDLEEGAHEFGIISDVVSREMAGKTRQAVILSLLAILIYISWAFSKVYRPIPSWQYGLAALVALFFDVLVMLGVFVVLGRFLGAEINIPIITALLIVFGYSVNDSVVVFDRIRENLLKGVGRDYVETVNYSLNQTLGRSLKTSFTTIMVLLFLLLFGGSTLYFFALALIVGIASGTYSSLFVASPLLVDAHRRRFKGKT